VNGIDPNGLAKNFMALLGTAIHSEIFELYWKAHFGNIVKYDTRLPTTPLLKPDIMDYTLGQIGEVKPFSPYGMVTGTVQLYAAISVANGLKTTYKSHVINISTPIPHSGQQANWIQMTWQPGFQVVWPERQNLTFAPFVAVTIGNINGVLYYYRFNVPKLLAPSLVFSPVFELAIQPIAQELHELLKAGQTVLDESTQ
jgi:hypothetical protein